MRRFFNSAFIAAFATLLCTGLPAFSEETTPYCPEKEPSAPDGIIVQMQDQFYRTCGRWTGRKKTLRQFTLRINPTQIPDLFTAYPSYNLRLAEQLEGQNALQSSNRNKPNLGTKQFGGFNYISYASDFLGPTGKPNRITYVFAGNEEIPRHWVNCTGMGFAVENNDDITCFVWLLENGVYANASLLMDYEDWPQMAEPFFSVSR